MWQRCLQCGCWPLYSLKIVLKILINSWQKCMADYSALSILGHFKYIGWMIEKYFWSLAIRIQFMVKNTITRCVSGARCPNFEGVWWLWGGMSQIRYESNISQTCEMAVRGFHWFLTRQDWTDECMHCINCITWCPATSGLLEHWPEIIN